ncbi:MAG: extracellular solute-binding protein [Eubacteriales bacterium]|nr:extracellular solute-binding protein [Eubacteriales bacterium]
MKQNNMWKKSLAAVLSVSMLAPGMGVLAEEAEAEKPYEGVTLTWATTDNAATGAEMTEMVELIKEKTGINIEFSIVPTSNAGEIDKVLVGLMAGDEIDIISRTPVQLKEFYNAGVLEPLDELAAAAGYDMEATYGDNLITYDDGQVYALPEYADIWLTYYNKKIFDDAGVEYPSAEGWTWEKYIETAKLLQNDEEGIWGSFMLDYDNYNYMYALQSGAECYKEDGTSNFDDEIFKTSLKFFYDFGNELKVQPSSVEYASGTYPYNSFMVNGNIGMFICGGWVASTLTDLTKYPRDWEAGILPMPYPEGQEASSLYISTGVAVPKTSVNKDAAFAAISCIAENLYTLGHGRIPVRRDLTDEEVDTYITEQLLPGFEHDGITLEDIKTAWFDNDRNLVFEKITGTADTTINQIWVEEGQLYGQGSKSLDEAMESIKTRSDEAIAEALEE